MNGRKRFGAVMDYQQFDRLPLWFFGTWGETNKRWIFEDLTCWDRVVEKTGMSEHGRLVRCTCRLRPCCSLQLGLRSRCLASPIKLTPAAISPVVLHDSSSG